MRRVVRLAGFILFVAIAASARADNTSAPTNLPTIYTPPAHPQSLTLKLLRDFASSDPKIRAIYSKGINDAIGTDLTSRDALRMAEAVYFLENRVDPKWCRAMLEGKWLAPLLEARQYETLRRMIETGFSDGWSDARGMATMQYCQVQMLLAQGKNDAALSAAKSYYNVCPLQDTARAIDLVARALQAARGKQDPDIARRFRLQQLALTDMAATTQPSDLGSNILANIVVDSNQCTDQIALAAKSSRTMAGQTGLGNLLLLADRTSEASAAFESALSMSTPDQLANSIANVARAVRAENRCIAPANAYILAMREKGRP